ncbi:MAG: DUF975 family protein [Lachnospiraceae bacterium]|nr:DUF975 family protein [Lachnospiraceae bacterium]
MWSISEVKKTGLAAFKKSYWGCVLVSLILGLLAAGSSLTGSSGNMNNAFNGLEQMGISSPELTALKTFLLSTILIFTICWVLLRIFLLNLIEVGCHAYLKDNITGEVTLKKLGVAFSDYKRNALTILLRDVFLALWICLLIIPGIIKSYSYMMVPYILLDEPELSGKEVITRSREMMNGHKWRAFLMDLSFIGWMFLSFITCGLVGIFYEKPYRMSAKAALYHELKKEG